MRLPAQGMEGREKPGAIRCDEGTVGAVVSFSAAIVRPAAQAAWQRLVHHLLRLWLC